VTDITVVIRAIDAINETFHAFHGINVLELVIRR
jgi:hypothetical protein